MKLEALIKIVKKILGNQEVPGIPRIHSGQSYVLPSVSTLNTTFHSKPIHIKCINTGITIICYTNHENLIWQVSLHAKI
jgi:hypothetical protein